MNKILENFKKYSISDDVLYDIYGISSNTHYDYVFVAPSWDIEKLSITDCTKITETRVNRAYELDLNGKKCLYVCLNIGAPNMIEFCLSCHNFNADNFIMIGAVGSLVPEIKIGTIVIPETSISGDGASVYLYEKLDSSNMFKKAYSDKNLNNRLKNACIKNNITPDYSEIISVDSIIAEYSHLEEFKNMGAKLIEMETAVFFNAMKLINKKASALLLVSDNSAIGEHLLGRSQEESQRFYSVRSKIKDILMDL